MDDLGDFFFAWDGQSPGDPSTAGLYGRLYDYGGTAQTDEFVISPYAVGSPDTIVAADAAGDFAVAWNQVTDAPRRRLGCTTADTTAPGRPWRRRCR